MRTFVTIIAVPFFAHWTMDMQFDKHAVVPGRARWGMLFTVHSLTSLRGRTRFPLF